MLLAARLFSGDVEESQAARYFERVGSVFGGFGVTLRPRGEFDRPGDPAIERLDAPGDAEKEVNGTVSNESSRRLDGSVGCGGAGGESAELAEDAGGPRSGKTKASNV